MCGKPIYMLKTCEIIQAHDGAEEKKNKLIGTRCSGELWSLRMSSSFSAHLDMQPEARVLFWHASVLAAVKDYVEKRRL